MDRNRRDLSFWWATFFGSGLAKVAPGTFGSLASFVIWAPVVLLDVPIFVRLILLVAIFVTGTWASERTAIFLDDKDPKSVVIDEVVGQGIVILPLFSVTPLWTLPLSFVLFRIFDVLKPFPVSWADQNIHGGLGIMLDDVIAGFIALVVLIGVVYGLGQLGICPEIGLSAAGVLG